MSNSFYLYSCKFMKSLPFLRPWSRAFSKIMEEFDENKLPTPLQHRKPKEPKPEDCCGDGCKVCVYDVYDQEMKIWKNECYQFLGIDIVKDEKPDQIEWISPLYYTTCTLQKIKWITRNCNLYRFILPDNTQMELKPGEHLIMRGDVNGETVTRQYTPLSHKTNSFHVLIKIYEQGLMSKFVSGWKEGCHVDWRGPSGHFPFNRNTHQKLVLLAAGTGIAPMVQIIRAILEDESEETRIHLFFCCRTYEEILIKDQLDEWKQFWNFQVTYCLSQEEDHSKLKYGDKVIFEQLSSCRIEKELSDYSNTRVLICGTKLFNSGMLDYLKLLRFPDENIHTF